MAALFHSFADPGCRDLFLGTSEYSARFGRREVFCQTKQNFARIMAISANEVGNFRAEIA